ncbi:unnamed protein product [marine sediment metagenome]|uniref:Undecaprenyl-diphosphatase n=1 Tax=marine sediment metagenome TaxID=412755 RepID=X1K481_9ZZZZ
MSFILLGLIQGLTEFFPVSSSGHLVIAKYFLQLNLPGAAFEAFVHFGTVVAVILLFRKEIKGLVISFFFVLFILNIFIGLAQAVAIIPGISRSGLTVITGMSRNLDREFAARYSFILSVPIILGASMFKMRELSYLNIDLSILILSGVSGGYIKLWGYESIYKIIKKSENILFFILSLDSIWFNNFDNFIERTLIN